MARIFWFVLVILCSSYANMLLADNKAMLQQSPLFPVSSTYQVPNAKATFDEIRQLILSKYYTTTLTEDDLYAAAIKGMLQHISPPQSPDLATLWQPEEYNNAQSALKGINQSLGAKLTYNPKDNSLTVTDVIPGSPAAKKLRPLDRIMRIDGQPLVGKTPQIIQSLLDGSAGSKIKLYVVRDIEVREIELTRGAFQEAIVDYHLINNTTAFIRIKAFTQNLHLTVGRLLADLKQKGITSIIVDLRNNQGGVFLEGLKTAELFLAKDTIMIRTLVYPEKINNYVSSNTTPFNFKTIILTNIATASSSEIFTAALQINKKADVVGTRTNGKATLEQTFELKNNYHTKFIIGAMYDANGHSWHSNGLQPDYYVAQQPQSLAKVEKLDILQRLKTDQPLATAWKLLNP